MRVTVSMMLGLLSAGRSTEEVLAAYPYLTREDILAALACAAGRTDETEVPLSAE
jgi:uncharacterized protein (DUF433 family)